MRRSLSDKARRSALGSALRPPEGRVSGCGPAAPKTGSKEEGSPGGLPLYPRLVVTCGQGIWKLFSTEVYRWQRALSVNRRTLLFLSLNRGAYVTVVTGRGAFDPQTLASGGGSFLGAVGEFWSPSGRVYLPQYC